MKPYRLKHADNSCNKVACSIYELKILRSKDITARRATMRYNKQDPISPNFICFTDVVVFSG